MSNRFLSSAIFSGLTTAFATAGEVTTDGSMGAAQTLTGPNYTIGPDLGTTVGNNLFHSFGTFNLSQGDIATFTGANTIQNVISRVTDGNPSSIDGTIQSQVGNANFFFINPAGIIFGQHAAIDVPAAFHASTANELRFADGSSYNLHTSKGSLTAAAPESFGFLGRTGDIVIEGSQLNFKEGTEVSFTGNSVTSNGATIEVPRGSLRVYGNGDAVGNVPINGELPSGNGAITMNGGNWNVNGDGGGDIWISGGAVSVINGAGVFNHNTGNLNATGNINIIANTLMIDNGAIKSRVYASGNSSNIVINVNDSMQILGGGVISTSIYSCEIGACGTAGNININTGSLIIDDSGIGSISDLSGNAGNLTINARERILVLGGVIANSVYGSGNAGNITLTANSLIIDGGGSEAAIMSVVLPNASGHGGNIVINVSGDMQAINGGTLFTDTTGIGNGGNILVSAGSLLIDTQNSSHWTGISADSFSIGNAGNVTIHVNGDLQILNAGFISSGVYGVGNGGIITVSVGNDLIIDDRNAVKITGIYARTLQNSTGNSGSIIVNVNGEIRMNGVNAQITAVTMSVGNVGNIFVSADNIIMNDRSTISASTISSGQAGNVIVNANETIQVLNWSAITSSSLFVTGNGGNVNVTAGNLIVADNAMVSSIATTGNAGNVTVTVEGDMQLNNGGTVLASTLGSGNGGIVTVNVGGTLQILNGSHIGSLTTESGNGNDITVNVGNLIIDGQKQTSRYFTGISNQGTGDATGVAGNCKINVRGEIHVVNGIITSANYGTGNAGSIEISANSLLQITNGEISTLAQTGHGGDIIITAPAIVLNNSQITTSVTGAGKDGGDITLNGGYLVFDTGFIQANTVGVDAKGGDIFINMDGVLPNGGVTIVGGEHRDFIPHSGQNVIQAAANATENDGTITITNPSDSSAAGLTGAANRLEPMQIAKNPCIGIKKRASLRRKGRGGLLKSSLKSNLLKTNDYAPNSKDVAHTNRKQRQQEVCAEG